MIAERECEPCFVVVGSVAARYNPRRSPSTRARAQLFSKGSECVVVTHGQSCAVAPSCVPPLRRQLESQLLRRSHNPSSPQVGCSHPTAAGLKLRDGRRVCRTIVAHKPSTPRLRRPVSTLSTSPALMLRSV